MSDIYIDNASAHSSYGVSLELQLSKSEILSSSTHLNSNIAEESGLRGMLFELLKIDPEVSRTVVSMKEEDIKAHFNKQSKISGVPLNILVTLNFLMGHF